MRIKLISKNDRAIWEELVAHSSDATLGHLWSWRDTIEAAYGFKPFYLMAFAPGGEAVAALPFIFIRSFLYGRELTSMPYIDYGGICHRDSMPAEEQATIDRIMLNQSLHIGRQLRAARVHARSPKPFDPRFALDTEKVTQHLALAATAEAQHRLLPSERRNRLRHCERAGLTVELADATDERALRHLSSVYSENMRDLGSPTHSHDFLHEIGHRFRERTSIIMVRHNQAVIAAGMSFEFNGFFSLPWTGATYAAKAVYGTNALYWKGICLGIERGCHTFDFGRSSVDSGIFEFKRRWKPEPHQAYWNTFYLKEGAMAPRKRPELQMATKLWRKMPLGVARAMGPNLRKGISN